MSDTPKPPLGAEAKVGIFAASIAAAILAAIVLRAGRAPATT